MVSVKSARLWMTFSNFFFYFLLLTRCPKSTFSEKTSYFGTYGAFRSSLLVQAQKRVVQVY
jgi:hypothetical protein